MQLKGKMEGKNKVVVSLKSGKVVLTLWWDPSTLSKEQVIKILHEIENRLIISKVIDYLTEQEPP